MNMYMYDHCLKIDSAVERKGFSYHTRAYKITSTDSLQSGTAQLTVDCVARFETLGES